MTANLLFGGNMNKFIKLATLATLSLTLLSACAFQNYGKFDDSQKSSEESKTEIQSAGIGDTISDEEFKITLNSAKFSKSDLFDIKPENDNYLILDVSIENLSDEENSISSLISFELQGSDNFEYTQSLTAKKKGNLDGSIQPGGKLRGQIAYDVADLESYLFTYKNSLLSDSVSFQINANQIQ